MTARWHQKCCGGEGISIGQIQQNKLPALTNTVIFLVGKHKNIKDKISVERNRSNWIKSPYAICGVKVIRGATSFWVFRKMRRFFGKLHYWNAYEQCIRLFSLDMGIHFKLIIELMFLCEIIKQHNVLIVKVLPFYRLLLNMYFTARKRSIHYNN